MLTIDEDVAALLRATAGKSGLRESDLASSILRRALRPDAPGAPAGRFAVRPHNGVFQPGGDLQKLNRMAAEERLETMAAW